ncbi:MAG TPA: hypothetical protein VKV39_17950 [Candidatus Sulfotelmatobacter sp.]|nr:hypothetical protein [Candidatus Sulfotelmatobacter sp.]
MESYGRTSVFSVVAETKVDLDTDTSGRTHFRVDPHVVVTGSHQSYDIQVELMGSASKAKLLLKENNKQIVVISDGKTVWTLIPAQRAYTELPATSPQGQKLMFMHRGDDEISGVDLLDKYQTLLATRFREAPGSESSAKLEHPEMIKVGKNRRECYVLTTQTPRGVEKEKLWVDKEEFIVWKSVDKTVMPSGYEGDVLQTTVTVTTKQMSLNPSLDESNFVFTPPDRAKNVTSLKLSGNNLF